MLVPGSLTVYRHFGVDLGRGLLTSMSYTRRMADTSPSHRLAHVYKPFAEVHEAVCTGGWMCLKMPHDTPDKGCRCGFYAHYDPDTDFYPSTDWGKTWARQVGHRHLEDRAIVRAVAEASGRNVAGRLGVRAAKLKVKAIAIDWAKHVTTAPIISDDPLYDVVIDSWGTLVWRRGHPTPDEREEVEAKVRDVAALYGVRLYDDPAEMYADHPKADVSALGIDTTPRRDVTAALAGQMVITAQQAAQMAEEIRKNVQRVTEAFRGMGFVSTANATLDETTRDALLGKPMTTFERVMLAKKSRPAPPGTGIDRRKRKL
jgi:hypothetical protein